MVLLVTVGWAPCFGANTLVLHFADSTEVTCKLANEPVIHFDVNHFYCNGGTVIGLGYKSERPSASKSAQAAIRLNKVTGVQRYVRVTDAGGTELATMETPAYATMTVVYSSPSIEKGVTYTILMGSNPNALQQLTTVQAE